MQHFFILGTNPSLSVAELYSFFGSLSDIEVPNKQVALLHTEKELDTKAVSQKIGGAIKIGTIESETEDKQKDIIEEIVKIVPIKEKTGKFKFGISYYGNKKLDTKSMGMELKKILKEKGVNSRMVTSQDKTLSSVVVEQNKLTSSGLEIVLIKNQNKILVGSTKTVQPFKELSRRDYGRPQRDDRSGMLPPKLAQIMLNLSGIDKNETLLDPFCGSGTILTEALLLGYKDVIGTDSSAKAVSDTQKNIDWITDHYQLTSCKAKVFQKDCTRLSSSLSAGSVGGIVTEPYLGPQRGHYKPEQIARELEELYSQYLQECKKILKKQGTMVIIFPVFTDKKSRVLERIRPDLHGLRIIAPLPSNLVNGFYAEITDRNTIIYGRPQQKIWREIVILKP